jgi:hypothetical protein
MAKTWPAGPGGVTGSTGHGDGRGATPLQPSRKSDLGASAVPLVGVRHDMYGRLFR